jgi:hypothetical protein
MGNRGKVVERQRARELRAQAWTLADIASELGVAKSSVSLWVRDVDFEPGPRRRARKRGPNKLERAKAAEIEHFRVQGVVDVGCLSEREFLMAGLGLYAGDGSKGDGSVAFSNSSPAIISFFCSWFRRFFDIDEARLRIKLYLHADLDLDAAVQHWESMTGVPASQFTKAYRAVVDESRRHNRHVFGCCHVIYNSTPAQRRLLGLMEALISSSPDPG